MTENTIFGIVDLYCNNKWHIEKRHIEKKKTITQVPAEQQYMYSTEKKKNLTASWLGHAFVCAKL